MGEGPGPPASDGSARPRAAPGGESARAAPGGELAPEPRVDPTRMTNQPALQTSNGRIWVIMGGLLAAASLIPLLLLASSGGDSAPIALTAGIAVVALYAAIVVLRFAIPLGPRRLRWLAACTLTMAAVALVGVSICAVVEAS